MKLLRALGLSALVLLGACAPMVTADSPRPAKPGTGAVASAHTLATEAGMEILSRV